MLAAANALLWLAGNRSAALWQAVAAVPDHDLLWGATDDDETSMLAPLTEDQEIVSDYRANGLTLGRHPLALREQLDACASCRPMCSCAIEMADWPGPAAL